MVNSLLPLKIIDTTVRKGGKTVIGPLDLEITGNDITMIMGPNGSGKTTLLRTMHGLEKLHTGEIVWNCETLMAQHSQAFVFQTPIMLRRTVLENILYPLSLKKMHTKQAMQTAHKWLEKIELGPMANIQSTYLSGGEKQKLALARALAPSPKILFLDEPTSNLDGTSTREIETIISQARDSGIKIIMTTHDTGQAQRIAEEVIFLYRGKLHDRGETKAFFANPQTQQARSYLKGEIVE